VPIIYAFERQFVCMINKHTKSPCCGAETWRFGKRRRQCIQCRKTWRIRKKKRGRKQVRGSQKLLQDILYKKETIKHRAARGRSSFWRCWLRYHKQLDKELKLKSVKKMPPGKVILVVDGLWINFKSGRWVIYLIAVRNINSHKATILEPFFLPGAETSAKWECLFQRLHPRLSKRVVALVCDGITGMRNNAIRNGWAFQRCHFHFINVIERFRGRVNKNIRLKEFREDYFQSIKAALYVKSPKQYQELIEHIKMMIQNPDCPKWLRRYGNEFIRHKEEFRTYLKYPEYNLPTTTSAMEKYCGTLRELLNRSHGFKTIESMKKWIILYARKNYEITCNGKIINQY